MHDRIYYCYDSLDFISAGSCTARSILLTETSVKAPGNMFEPSSESDAIWNRAITQQITELHSNVFRIIVIVSKLN